MTDAVLKLLRTRGPTAYRQFDFEDKKVLDQALADLLTSGQIKLTQPAKRVYEWVDTLPERVRNIVKKMPKSTSFTPKHLMQSHFQDETPKRLAIVLDGLVGDLLVFKDGRYVARNEKEKEEEEQNEKEDDVSLQQAILEFLGSSDAEFSQNEIWEAVGADFADGDDFVSILEFLAKDRQIFHNFKRDVYQRKMTLKERQAIFDDMVAQTQDWIVEQIQLAPTRVISKYLLGQTCERAVLEAALQNLYDNGTIIANEDECTRHWNGQKYVFSVRLQLV